MLPFRIVIKTLSEAVRTKHNCFDPGFRPVASPFPSSHLQSWPDFDELLWKQCVRGAKSCKTNWPQGLRILGNDIHGGALDLCR